MAPLRGALLAVLALSGCGYRSAVPAFDAVYVPAVRSRAPEPELAACLTRELREGLAASGVRQGRREGRRLEVEVLQVRVGPGALVVRGGRLAPADQSVSLAVRASLVERRRGVVLGPTVHRVETAAAQGSTALESRAGSRAARERACRELAGEILEALASSPAS